MFRTRWAAFGAAIAVTLGAGGIGLVAATTPSDASTFVPITPCRVIDTRPDFQVGPRSAPLAANDTYDVTATGTSGECDAVPSGATGVVLNVTTTDATHLTFLTIWEAGAERPNASHLNPTPGAPPTPNAVTTAINGDGAFSIYNLQGTVHVLADIVGYYTDHHHDDRYYTKGEADGRYQTEDQSDERYVRLGVEGSVTLASGAFTPRDDAALSWQAGTSCFRPEPASAGMRHTIPLSAGSIVTSIGVRATSPIYPSQFTLTLFAQRPGSSAGQAVWTQTFPTAANTLLDQTVDIPDEHVDPGEALYLAFVPADGVNHLCAATVGFTSPGT